MGVLCWLGIALGLVLTLQFYLAVYGIFVASLTDADLVDTVMVTSPAHPFISP